MEKKNLLTASLLLAGLVLLTNCSGKKDRSSFTTSENTDESTIRIMPLGNSITYGNYHPEPRPEGMITGYRQALWLMLKEAGYNVDFVGSRTTGADAEPAFDPHNEGYPGWTDDQIKENVYKWLKKNPPHIIILHIGTNGLNPDPKDVEGIFDEIDRYENDYDHHIRVIMTKIINRSTYSQLTTQFNQNIEKMAIDRVVNDGDDIVVIDMEFETDIDYRLNTSGGEMFDNLHPFVGGHEKMAVRWFEALQEVLPRPNQISKEISDSDSHTIDFDSGIRIEEGLVALYSFTEGKGNRVYDVSGVGSPLDLYINYEGNIIWDSVQGLEVTRKAILIPSDMNMKVIDSCMASNAISLETWIRTGNIEQDGPAHIVSISDPLESGITISQEFEYTGGTRYFFTRDLHTTTSGSDGSSGLSTDNMFSSITLQHLIYTRNANGLETLYIDGKEAATANGTGDFSSWNKNTFKLSLCNSLGFDNPWKGKLFLTAIYNVALSAEQVAQNFAAGFGNNSLPVLPEQPEKLTSTALSAVAARLTWKEQQGDVTGFVIHRKESSGEYRYVASVTNYETEFIDVGLTANTSYHYRIRALNNYGESPYSLEAEVRTLSDESLEDVALQKKATQSSTTFKGRASRGVDGNTDGIYSHHSITHTAYEMNAWWEVDLDDVYYIDHMEVWNRVDQCCNDRLARFYIFISEKPFESYDLQTTLDQSGVATIYQEFFPDPMTTFNVAGKGRYIRIQLSDSQNICLAELVVMGSHLKTP